LGDSPVQAGERWGGWIGFSANEQAISGHRQIALSRTLQISKRERARTTVAFTPETFTNHYVTSALICNRFLTRDEEQARMCRIFELGGFWIGKVIYIPPGKRIRAAIPSALI
jgi:hypothetical protein